MANLVAACLTFVGLHFVLSSIPVRSRFIARVGDQGFRGLYSLASLAAFVWVIMAYREAPFVAVWAPPAWTRHMMMTLMLAALFLVVSGVMTKSPTAMGQEAALAEGPKGIVKLTRHPGLSGIALWGLLHLSANGDQASMVLFGSMVALSVLGMLHIDHRRAAAHGEVWAGFAAQTSRTPGLAVLTGRTRLAVTELSLAKTLVVTALLYGGLFFAHKFLSGVALIR